jgi:hypothetical protein
LQIYALYLNLIVNICLPLTSLIAMNICIYKTMRNQWYRQNHGNPEGTVNGSPSSARGGMGRESTRIVHFLSSRQSSAATEVHHQGIRRVGGINEAAYKKRDAKYTRASVVMVVAFVVCNTPRFVPNIMEIFLSLEDFPQVRGMVVAGMGLNPKVYKVS